jgi:hypothetical protein
LIVQKILLLLQQHQQQETPVVSFTFTDCLRSIALVESRAFQLSKVPTTSPAATNNHHCVMVPVLDVFNHPSKSSLQHYGDEVFANFITTPISQSTIEWTVVNVVDDDDSAGSGHNDTTAIIRVYGPKGLQVKPNDELWNWYGNGGYVMEEEQKGDDDPSSSSSSSSSSKSRWDHMANEEFIYRYGFDPWI